MQFFCRFVISISGIFFIIEIVELNTFAIIMINSSTPFTGPLSAIDTLIFRAVFAGYVLCLCQRLRCSFPIPTSEKENLDNSGRLL